jgi:hypothetical protein
MYSIYLRKQFDLSPMVSQRNFFIATAYPKPVQKFLALLTTFDFFTWIFTVIFFIIFTIVLTFVSFNGKENTLDTPFLLTLGILTNSSRPQHQVTLLGMPSRQIIIVFWLLAGLILGMAYKSNLLASLINIEYEKPIDTLTDVMNAELDLYIVRGTQVPDMMKFSANENMRLLYEKVRFLYFENKKYLQISQIVFFSAKLL